MLGQRSLSEVILLFGWLPLVAGRFFSLKNPNCCALPDDSPLFLKVLQAVPKLNEWLVYEELGAKP